MASNTTESDQPPQRRPSPRPRRGRPRAEDAGSIDSRILDAATQLFLTSGLRRTTYDHVAAAAHTSKSTLYDRWPTKAALFAAVVDRQTHTSLSHLPTPADPATSNTERLIRAGNELAEATLTTDGIALMRVTCAEADALPDVARLGFRVGFTECVRVIATAIAATDHTAAVTAATPLATRFVELALHPLYMHALFGADLDRLRHRAPTDIASIATHLTAVLSEPTHNKPSTDT